MTSSINIDEEVVSPTDKYFSTKLQTNFNME